MGRGHEVTLFNRGITRPDLFPAIEKLRGVRSAGASDLRSIAGSRRWDAVIDVWPEDRTLVEETAALLRERTDYYFYVSSIAVYDDFSSPGLNESAAVQTDPVGSYGVEKAAAERVVRSAFAGRHGIARCPAILGPYDPGTSYHYWLRRMATGTEVLCPGSGADPVQTIDVRDLSRWVLDSIETVRDGTFNLTGAWPPRSMRDLLEATAEGVRSSATLTWVDADYLRRDHQIQSFSEMPLWAPLDEDEGFNQIDGRAAINVGAAYRDITETASDSWRWFQSHFFKDVSFPYQGTGISAEREQEILRAWHSRRG
jgi:2'-hydroxyisoflavone reductase